MFAIAVAIIVVLLGTIITVSIDQDEKFEAMCKKDGGVPIINRSGRVCYAPGTVINMQKR